MFSAGFDAEGVESLAEQESVFRGDWRVVLPGDLGCGSVESPGSGGGVGQQSSGFDVVTSPLSGTAMAGGVVMGVCLERTDARLAGAIVARGARRGEE